MSTIPVLLLSLMMLSLSEAEEMMEPFALIRQTLKYWFKIYKIYHEEVALGYCWAEYFLRLEGSMQNVSMSRFPERRSSEFTNSDNLEKKYTFFRNGRSIPVDSKEHVRNKRSYRILHSKEEASRTSSVVKEKLDTIRVQDWRSIDTEGSYSSKQPNTLLFPNEIGEFKENRTEGSRKPKMSQVDLGSSFLFKFFRPESFASSLAIERIADLVDAKEPEDNENDSDRGRNSSNLKFRRVEQRSSTSEQNLRGKRDVNDQIGFVWPPRIKQQSPSMYDVWKTESRSSSSRSVEILGKNRLWNGIQRSFDKTSGYTNVPLNARSNIKALSVIPAGIVNAPGQFITINRRAWPKNPSPDKEKKRGSNCENGSEQLPGSSDNRYRRNHFLIQKSLRGNTVGHLVEPRINYPRFLNYDSWGGRSICRWDQSSWTEDQGTWNDLVEPRGVANIFLTFLHIRETFMGFLRTLGFFVQVGRELIDYVESNSALACTKDYLWNKAVQWIDS